MNYNGDIHFSFFFQADACYFLAQLISETTNPIKRGVGQDTSDKIESSIKNSEPSVAEKILRMAMQKKWIPTEKIIKIIVSHFIIRLTIFIVNPNNDASKNKIGMETINKIPERFILSPSNNDPAKSRLVP